ncbi:MAG: hypothetical protein KGL39_29325 [Patescibacteria group bacterium]|nr:hypothetical protein [Patescibacteria group bacterium]
MFSTKAQAVIARLQPFLPQGVAQALQDTFCNPEQDLSHKGQVSLSTYQQQPSLKLHNGFSGQSALESEAGNIVLGVGQPAGAANPNQFVNNNPLTQNNYGSYGYPQTFNDDVRMAGDSIHKWCMGGLASTIARVQLSQSAAPGQTIPAYVIDAAGNPITTMQNSGMGGGKIMVRLPPCLNNLSSDQQSCVTFKAGTCGYAAYFADTATGGAVKDCAERVNIAQYWELISAFFVPTADSHGNIPVTQAVTKICCSTVNGQSALVVCTTDYKICAQVTTGSVDCGGGSCS